VRRKAQDTKSGFSLVEVVLALGVVAVAIIAILGIVPVGLTTSHSAQDETRAAQIAQAIISSVASQARTQFSNIQLHLDDNSIQTLDLTIVSTATVYADNDGKLSSAAGGTVYTVKITTDSAPTGFDTGYANEMTVSVAWPRSALSVNQTKRNFVRIISKY